MSTPHHHTIEDASPIVAAADSSSTPGGVNNSSSAAAHAAAGGGGGSGNEENQHHQHHDQQQNNQQLDSLASQLSAESAKIQVELERLKQRRRLIAEQQRALNAVNSSNVNSRSNSSQQHHQMYNQQQQQQEESNSRSQSHFLNHVDLTNVVTHPGDLPLGGTQRKPIGGELYRRRSLHLDENPHFAMKEAIKHSLESDSTITGGYFMPNPHASKSGTFSRAPRFSAPVGKSGGYYLSYDQQQLQGPNCRKDRRVLVASSRGRPNSNVNSHWNDPKAGATPGPAAYNPRHWFISKGCGSAAAPTSSKSSQC